MLRGKTKNIKGIIVEQNMLTITADIVYQKNVVHQKKRYQRFGI